MKTSTYKTLYKGNSTNTSIVPYVYKGRKNETILPDFVNICKKTQKELIDWLPNKLIKSGYTDVVKGKGYIYAKGTVPVLLTAHMDTVHDELVKEFYEHEENGRHILTSPQGIGGDDRCGIYMILEIIKTHKCSVLFCEDEEIGCIGSKEFCKSDLIYELSSLNYLIELDRANSDDAVFYECDNEDFTKFITDNTGYVESYGSYSDISYLAPMAGVAAVNLSCGYYNAHTKREEVVIEEMLNTIKVVKKLLNVESEQFEYIEAYNYYKSGYYSHGYYDKYYGRYGYGYDDYDDDYDYDSYLAYYNATKNKTKNETLHVYIKGKMADIVSHGKTQDEAWKNFFMNNPTVCYNEVLSYYFM